MTCVKYYSWLSWVYYTSRSVLSPTLYIFIAMRILLFTVLNLVVYCFKFYETHEGLMKKKTSLKLWINPWILDNCRVLPKTLRTIPSNMDAACCTLRCIYFSGAAPAVIKQIATGQTTVNKKAPIHYIISINDMVYRPL